MPIRLLVPLLFIALPGLAAPPCAETIRDLRTLLDDPSFPLQWRETSMNDGKPMLVTILERDGALAMSFVKTNEGVWVEGASRVCAKGEKLEAHFVRTKMVVGRSAHWAMRYSLMHGGGVSLVLTGAAGMKISTIGWSGTFAPREPD